MSSLQDRILKHYAKSKFDTQERDFLTEGSIDELITKESVWEELEVEQSSQDSEENILVEYILRDAKKVFAIVVIIDLDGANLREAMMKFQKNNFRDESLPVKREELSTLPCFSGTPWTKPVRKQNFFREQWRFLAPVFSKTKFQLYLEPDCILPFVWRSYEVKEGTFSQVFEVRIHESHWKDPVLTVSGQAAQLLCRPVLSRAVLTIHR